MKRSFRRPFSPLVVPGYLDIRSENSPNSPNSLDSPNFASTAASSATVTASSSTDVVSAAAITEGGQLTAAKEISVSRSSTEVVVIVVTLILLVGVIFGAIVVYKKKGSKGSGIFSCLKRRSKDKATKKAVPDSSSGTNVASTDSASTLVNEKSDQSPESSSRDAGGLLQKLQGIFSGSNKNKEATAEFGVGKTIDDDKSQPVPQYPPSAPRAGLVQKLQGIAELFKRNPQSQWPSDLERAALPLHESGPTESISTDVEWSRRPSSVAGRSIHTESSMAIHPALARIKSVKKTGLRPGISAFSWSTNMPTPIPPSHHSTKDNPLPPFPISDERDATNRDSVLTTMTEDYQPTRYRNIGSWVGNVQERHDRRVANQEMPTPASEPTQLQVPSAVADTHGQQRDTRGSVRMSALASESLPTPAIETATVAFAVPVRAREVEQHQATQQQQLETVSYSDAQPQHHLEQIPEQPSEEATSPPPAQDIPTIEPISSPSETITMIHEEDWIPNVTRYPSGTTSISGFPSWKAGEEPPAA